MAMLALLHFAWISSIPSNAWTMKALLLCTTTSWLSLEKKTRDYVTNEP
jgi:hypothetical protein